MSRASVGEVVEKLREVEGEPEYRGVIVQIVSLIDAGDLQPGQCLPGERVLADRFKVGRAAVRIALKFLEFIGVIEIVVGKGAFVGKDARSLAFTHVIALLDVLKDNPFKDLLEARRVIETKMAALAAVNAEPEDLENMERALTDIRQDLGKRGKGIHGTDQFHLAIYKASKNIILYRIGLMLQELMHASREITLTYPGRAQKSLEEHQEIFAAIKKGDSLEASRLMENHLCQVARVRSLL